MWKSSRKLQQDCLAKTGCHLCIKTANMSPWKKIVAKHVALGDCKCSRVQDDYQRGLVADVNVKKVWKIKETLRWETGEIMMITAAMVSQVDLSATGDKLPNAVVAFLTCEVSSLPNHQDLVRHISSCPFIKICCNSNSLPDEDWSKNKRQSSSSRGLWKVPQKVSTIRDRQS